MRVIGGEFRSRVLKTLPGLDVRPTPDRLREALFNILSARIPGTVFADLYAGSGAVGIEALSRGASRVIFVEHNRAAADVIRHNLKSLGAEGRAEVRPGRAVSIIGKLQADIVFLDPPYAVDREYDEALAQLGAHPPELVIVQHGRKRTLAETYGALVQTRVLRQGENCLSFYGVRGAD
jgi:16S rRNA (guanine(966)-N(2))-methyltransferase RsmD